MLGRIAGVLVVCLVAATVALLAFSWRPRLEPIAQAPAQAKHPALIARGAELALAGNCNACHTRPGGEAFSGGVPFKTDFGTVYSTNITPDRETGVGAWSEEAFRRALHEGVGIDGRHLYPAFPYDRLTKTTDTDVSAIYAFLMSRKAVHATPPANELSFPFNFRPLLAFWKLLYFEPARFVPDPRRSAELNHGAYLSEGLAHCGTCHSPRNRLGAEEKDRALSGGEAGSWHAPALDAQSPAPTPWTVDQLHTYLTTGFVEQHGVAAGPMQDVVNNLRRVPESDSRAIAAYIGSVLQPATAARSDNEQRIRSELAKAGSRLWQSAAAGNSAAGAGALLYAGSCAQCHEPVGLRFSAKGIPLALSKVLAMPDPRNLLHIIRDGITAPEGSPAALMPGYREAFTDAQIVELAAYLRARFSGHPPWTDLEQRLRSLDQAAGDSR